MDEIRQRFLADLGRASSSKEVEDVRISYLGRKGAITTLMKDTDFSQMTPGQRKEFGQKINELKALAEAEIAKAAEAAKANAAAAGTAAPVGKLDLTLPGRAHDGRHPSDRPGPDGVGRDLPGYGIYGAHRLRGRGGALQLRRLEHSRRPSRRDMQDTYWLTNGRLLRTHTSANQVRALERFGAPLRAIFPGRCFRHEAIDASHENTFYQLEGLMVDQDISVANLIAVMKTLLGSIFKREATIRLRPGFFPFVEPGFELDIQCVFCGGKGCPTCKQGGWIELIPCGLVHPRVLESGRIDTSRYSGFAFGLGLTRLAMMRFGIADIRLMNSGDIRFYEQFSAGV